MQKKGGGVRGRAVDVEIVFVIVRVMSLCMLFQMGVPYDDENSRGMGRLSQVAHGRRR